MLSLLQADWAGATSDAELWFLEDFPYFLMVGCRKQQPRRKPEATMQLLGLGVGSDIAGLGLRPWTWLGEPVQVFRPRSICKCHLNRS